MTDLLKKLNFRGQDIIFGINCPESLNAYFESVIHSTRIKKEVQPGDLIEFAIAFAIKQSELNQCIQTIAPQLDGDAIFWCCYPKQTSRKYNCDFNRDHGWEAMVPFGLKAVRLVSIDADWSALRFRKTAYIRTI